MSTLNKKPILSILNLILFMAVVYVNMLAVTLPINGKSTGELSDQYPNLFVPAGFTFSIWGVIYLLLLVFVIYQIWVSFNKKTIQKLKIACENNGVLIGNGYGNYSKNTFRIANFPAHTTEEKTLLKNILTNFE